MLGLVYIYVVKSFKILSKNITVVNVIIIEIN